MIIHDGTSVPVLMDPQDPDDTKRYTVMLRPPVWSPSQLCYEKESVVLPSQFSGFYGLARSGGITGSSEPVFPSKSNVVVVDGGVEWVMRPYDFILLPGMTLASATWSADNPAVQFSSEQTNSDKTSMLISGLPASVEKVLITVRLVYNPEGQEDKSFIIPVAQM